MSAVLHCGIMTGDRERERREREREERERQREREREREHIMGERRTRRNFRFPIFRLVAKSSSGGLSLYIYIYIWFLPPSQPRRSFLRGIFERIDEGTRSQAIRQHIRNSPNRSRLVRQAMVAGVLFFPGDPTGVHADDCIYTVVYAETTELRPPSESRSTVD